MRPYVAADITKYNNAGSKWYNFQEGSPGGPPPNNVGIYIEIAACMPNFTEPIVAQPDITYTVEPAPAVNPTQTISITGISSGNCNLEESLVVDSNLTSVVTLVPSTWVNGLYTDASLEIQTDDVGLAGTYTIALEYSALIPVPSNEIWIDVIPALWLGK